MAEGKNFSEFTPEVTSVAADDLLLINDVSAGTTNPVQASNMASSFLSSDSGNLLGVGTDLYINLDSTDLISTDASNQITAGTDNKLYVTGAGAGTVTSITAGTGLDGGTITTSGTIDLADTAVTAGSYTAADITVDAQGRVTAAASGSAASNDFEFISSQTASASSNIDFTDLDVDNTYKIFVSGVTCTATSAELDGQCSTNNGSTFDTTTANYGYNFGFLGGSFTGDSNAANGFQLSGQTGLNRGLNASTTNRVYTAEITIFPQTSGKYRNISVQCEYYNNSNQWIVGMGNGRLESTTSDVDAFRIAPNSGTITTGVFQLYKIANA